MLWIMRHASAGPTTDAKDDDKRPLDDEGMVEASAAGIALRKLKTPIQACLTSPLTRALQTAQLVCHELKIEPKIEATLHGPPVDNHAIKQMTRGLGNTLIVTHAPSCNLIVYRLTGAQVQITKGGACQVHEGEAWSVLNASTFLVMAQLADFEDPQDVDHRSADPTLRDRLLELDRSPERPPWLLV